MKSMGYALAAAVLGAPGPRVKLRFGLAGTKQSRCHQGRATFPCAACGLTSADGGHTSRADSGSDPRFRACRASGVVLLQPRPAEGSSAAHGGGPRSAVVQVGRRHGTGAAPNRDGQPSAGRRRTQRHSGGSHSVWRWSRPYGSPAGLRHGHPGLEDPTLERAPRRLPAVHDYDLNPRDRADMGNRTDSCAYRLWRSTSTVSR